MLQAFSKKRGPCGPAANNKWLCSGYFAANAARKLHVLGVDGLPPTVDAGQVRVLEHAYCVGFSCFLQHTKCSMISTATHVAQMTASFTFKNNVNNIVTATPKLQYEQYCNYCNPPCIIDRPTSTEQLQSSNTQKRTSTYL